MYVGKTFYKLLSVNIVSCLKTCMVSKVWVNIAVLLTSLGSVWCAFILTITGPVFCCKQQTAKPKGLFKKAAIGKLIPVDDPKGGDYIVQVMQETMAKAL